MTRTLLMLLLLLALVACKPEPPPPPPATPPPTPAPTPPPPLSTSGAQEAAIRLYPDLGVKGSLFNRTFLEVVEATRRERPSFFDQVDWPLKLAERTAGMLHVDPYAPPTPAPVVVRHIPTPTPLALDKGAYNQTHSVYHGRAYYYNTPYATPGLR